MAVTLTDLAEADLKISQAKREVIGQRDRLDRVKGGLTESAAKALLIAMEAALASLVHTREIIAAELDQRVSVERPSSAEPSISFRQGWPPQLLRRS